jgi:valyl-tRNA synthetase
MTIPAQFDAKMKINGMPTGWKIITFTLRDHRTPYTIVIPPPNVTGVLHMGHMLNNTIQDV